jgi:acyl phosphate:glycerol-3-phosphate acyltransferase
MDSLSFVFWLLVGFLSGAVPWSVILGRLARQGDIRSYGDHNPGATNVIRAAGWRWGAAAMVLDALKAALPVGLAWFWVRLAGWQIVLVALAPLVGHAYSPFLRGRGGKAVAASFGVWAGLTLGVGPTLLGLLLGVFYFVLQSSGWAVTLTLLSFGGFTATYYAASHPEFAWVWLGNFLLLVWKHRHELNGLPRLRPQVVRLVRRYAEWR